MSLEERARRHAALSDPRRLIVVDDLASGDRTVAELAEVVGIPGNLLAHHLDVLEDAGLVERRVSEGDRRRRYVTLRWDRLPHDVDAVLTGTNVVFVCTHNSARSQFAAALWQKTTGADVASAGSHPSERVHPKAVQVAAEFGVDLSSGVPGGYETIPWVPDLVISVCDRAREEGVPNGKEHRHWSIPDPVPPGDLASFRSAFADIAARVGHLSDERTAS
ncbi:MAG: helix-turn-helix domain-containing protein [Acidimicrobiia bacterium]|jgi:protein-tyrosine-phosphatase/DNA-binding transcriptional ArsR family regulator